MILQGTGDVTYRGKREKLMKKKMIVAIIMLLTIGCMEGCASKPMPAEETVRKQENVSDEVQTGVTETQKVTEAKETTAEVTDYSDNTEEETTAQVPDYSGDTDEETNADMSDLPDQETDIEKSVADIRKIYYDIQDNLSSYEHFTDEQGMEYYATDGQLYKIVVPAGTYDLENPDLERYSAEYYYRDNSLIFVFVFDGTEEHRYYMDCTKGLRYIRYIDETGTVHDYEEGETEADSPTGYFCHMGYMEPHFWVDAH